jgi:predicted O-linked N-acetylglucosamine transferase (SPINDLY family)
MVASILSSVGLTELIAETSPDYGDIAARLAGDIPRLANLRASLRSRMLASPVCNGVCFTRSLEAAYRQMWRRWCEAKTKTRPA